jgi:lipid-A-disaccharide synthase
MLKTALLIQRNLNSVQFIVVKSPQVSWDIYHPITCQFKIDLKIIEGRTYDCLNAADFCLVCSGTATLETAIMQKPFVIIYKMSLLNYLLYRPQVRVPYVGMVNIIAGKKIIPEFIQFGASPKRIASQSLKILQNPQEAQRIKDELAKIKSSLGEPGAAMRAAKIIVEFLRAD